jgi:hypothetical protein
MERVKGTPGEGKIQWRKLGRGFFRLPNRIIKPGEVFWARPDEIPFAFRDTIKPVDASELKEKTKVPSRPVKTPVDVRKQRMMRRAPVAKQNKEEEITDAIKPVYSIVSRGEGSPWYDIFDENGKQMNAKALRKEKAEEYKKSLEE